MIFSPAIIILAIVFIIIIVYLFFFSIELQNQFKDKKAIAKSSMIKIAKDFGVGDNYEIALVFYSDQKAKYKKYSIYVVLIDIFQVLIMGFMISLVLIALDQ